MLRNRHGFLALVFFLALILPGCGGGPKPPSPDEAVFAPTSPPEADNLWRQAEQAQKAGKLPTAIGLWEKIVQKFPTTPRAAASLNALGEVYLNQGQPDRAIQYFDYLLYAYPRWDGVNAAKLNLMRARIQMGKKKQAMKDAVPLWDASANQPEVRFGLATLMMDLYASENDVETALDWCASGFAAASTPEQKRALTKSTLDLVNRLDEGAVRKLSKKKPSDFMRVFFEYRLAAIEKEKGQADAARDRLKAALAQSPGHPLTPEIQAALRGTRVVEGPQIPLSPDKVGVLIPLNGPNAKYGDMVVRGLNMAVTDWTGMHPESKVNLVIKDAGSESAVAAQSFEELSKKEGVFAIIGPLGMQANKAVLPLANRDGIPLLSLTQKEDDGRDSSFALHVFIDSRDLVRTLVRHCREKLQYERFACLYPEDRYGQRLAKIFAETVQEQGGTMIASASYKEKSTDFKEPLQKLMNIAKKNAPLSATEGTPFDALFIPDQVSAVALIAPQLPYNNIVGTTLLGTNLWSEAPLVQSGGVYVDQALFATSFYPESNSPQVKSFREKYERLYNATPSYLEAQAYDALMMLLIARNSVTGTPDRNAVFQSLLQAKDFRGVAGVYTASPKGDLERQYTILQVVNGQLQQVSP